MLEQARATATHLCRVNELAPGLVREQRKRAEFAALFEMAKNFRGDAQKLFRVRGFGKLWAVFHQRFLRVRRFLMNFAHKSDQLLPRLSMRPAVLPRVNGREFPLSVSGKRLDRLRQIRNERF